MDQLLRTVSAIMEEYKARGSTKQFKSSAELVLACRKLGVIAEILSPTEIHKASREDYFTHLCGLTKKYLFGNPEQKHWSTFVSDPANRKVHKILHEFGVRQELFSDDQNEVYTPLTPSSRRITLEEFYEVCQIQFNFGGSFPAFKRYIQKTYGSFAEYCILKGFEINTTNWDSAETALRVAEKIGGIDEIKRRSPSLHKYLIDDDLITKIIAS